jgi:hypothetical protein
VLVRRLFEYFCAVGCTRKLRGIMMPRLRSAIDTPSSKFLRGQREHTVLDLLGIEMVPASVMASGWKSKHFL